MMKVFVWCPNLLTSWSVFDSLDARGAPLAVSKYYYLQTDIRQELYIAIADTASDIQTIPLVDVPRPPPPTQLPSCLVSLSQWPTTPAGLKC